MKDQLYTHSIINYILASYQGRFTYLNVLSQLQHLRFQADEITRTRNNITKASEWVAKLWQGQATFSPSVTDPGTLDAKMALKLLEDLKPDLKNAINELRRIISYPNIETKPEDVKFLIASFARFAYGRDN